ncbi:MAG: hypothetical protein BWY42_01758 [Candidatus Omnitrophica bacterium ADurb.Bin277]|nr:MAG: hypothetical protein BWY42_01758 [Candidatus Omnitrophica bacterium ADurb.Bin277]
MQDRSFGERVQELPRPVLEIRDRLIGLKQNVPGLDLEPHP